MNDSPPAASREDLAGRNLGGYRVLRRLGSGGMAEVFLAEQQSLGRQVALKVLHAQLAGDASYVQRLQNEARAAASLVHPGIVQIYEVGQAEGVHFIAQEYVQGKNLAQAMERAGALPPGLVLDILLQVVSALCKAQELGIVHRDLKPENILLSHLGEVKVADFGLARVLGTDSKTLTQVGVTMGTPLYMSPEQIEGQTVDARSDIYSLGVTVYHLLAGEPPHTGETALAIAVQHLNSTPRPLSDVQRDIPRGLARIVHRMLSKDPAKRPSSPSALLGELRGLASEAVEEGWAEGLESWSLGEGIVASPASSQARAELGDLMQAGSRLRLGGRNWGWLAVGLVVAALVGVAVAAVARPRFYLVGSQTPAVPVRSSAAAQLYHAKMSASALAWRAVWEEFPQADPFLHQLARQGLVRHFLLVTEEYQKAVQILRQLEQLSSEEDSLESLRAFTFAGLGICYGRSDRVREAREAFARLTPDMKDALRREESQLYELMQKVEMHVRNR